MCVCVQAFEVKIALGEASNLTVTNAQPQHSDYGCWFWATAAVGFWSSLLRAYIVAFGRESNEDETKEALFSTYPHFFG